ncbi:hypothetical protein PIIN_03544 [Serendipita indica DSM 11827]|uniref:Uncharacterized protein n=1 Tax=Serendipita indica (strain DSM 11827) TaxID=1109443 RepID=G4TE62_SERID|nr:hypothetical protein PIIN_03544 [Serendipita indica DSM 11827]
MPSSSSVIPRKLMLVPLPLVLQRSLKLASDVLPTFTLLSFVVVQFFLNIARYIPARYWQSWVDRSRLVLKVMLDSPLSLTPATFLADGRTSDYRRDRQQLDILHQRILELERRNASLSQNLDESNEEQRLLRERLVKQSQGSHKGDEDWQTRCRDAEASAKHYEADLARIKRQFDAQTQLLEETEGLLNTLRKSNDEARMSRMGNEGTQREALAQMDALRENEAALRTQVDDLTAKLEIAEASASQLTTQLDESNTKLQGSQKTLEAANTTLQDLRAQLDQETRIASSARNDLVAQNDAVQTQLHEAIAAREQAEQAYEAAVTSHDETVQSLVKVNEESDRSLQTAQKAREEAEQHLLQVRQELAAAQTRAYNVQLVNSQLQGKIKALEGMSLTIHALENSVAEKTRDNEAFKADIKAKEEEISRLNELLEHADQRAHKLKKPRRPSTSIPHADGAAEHARSTSISSRLGLDRFGSERQRTVSGSSTHGLPPAMAYDVGSIGRTSGRSRGGSIGAGSPSMSPAHRAQAALPNDQTAGDTSGPTSISFVVDEAPHDTSASASPEKHSHKRSSGSTRRRLSSILGLHDKHDKEKHEKSHTKEAS